MAIASNRKSPYGDVPQNPEFGLLDFNADGMVLTSAAANAIAAQYQPIANLVPVTALNQTNVSAVK